MVKQAAPTQELQKRTPSEVEVPDFLKDLAPGGVGFEEMSSEDQLLPRIQIAQALSPQMQKNKPEYLQDLEQGEFFNSVSGRIYGDSVTFIPLFFFHSAINIQDNKIICMSKDAKVCPVFKICKCNTWNEEGATIQERKPDCQKLLNYVVFVPGPDDLAIVSLKSTGIKVARKWNSLQKMLTLVNGQQYPMYTRQYTASTVTEQNAARQEYFQWLFRDAGWAPREFVLRAGPLVEGLRGKVVVDASGLAGDNDEENKHRDEEEF